VYGTETVSATAAGNVKACPVTSSDRWSRERRSFAARWARQFTVYTRVTKTIEMRWRSSSSRLNSWLGFGSPSLVTRGVPSSITFNALSPKVRARGRAISTSSPTAFESGSVSQSPATRPCCSPIDSLVVCTERGTRLRELAPAIVSRKAGPRFVGYMRAQKERLVGTRGQRRVNRPELIDAHGFDTKYAMHVARLGLQGIELLKTGRLTLPMAEPDRSRVMSIRRGDIPLDEAISEIEEIERRLEAAVEDSSLRDEPDYERVDGFLMDSYREAWAGADRRSKWAELESNQPPPPYQRGARPTELPAHDFAADAGFAGVGFPALNRSRSRSKSSWLCAAEPDFDRRISGQGLEPRSPRSERDVLPLDDPESSFRDLVALSHHVCSPAYVSHGLSRTMFFMPLAYPSTLDRRLAVAERRPTWRSFGARSVLAGWKCAG
jgi:hypothetical protein